LKLSIYQVDAFSDRVFGGNPAAVCPLDRWPGDELLQAIAAENNLAETAFYVRGSDGYDLRWFTPTTEVDLCGHATLATGFVLLDVLGTGHGRDETIRFSTRGGALEVARAGEGLVLTLPAHPPAPCDPPPQLLEGLARPPVEVLAAANYLAVYDDEEEILEIRPDFARLAECHPRGVIVTAPGRDVDFVSRFFAPSFGIPEDPVTGSAHSTLTPYWAARLGKLRLRARQVSARRGELVCELLGDRVALEGRCALYLEGTIEIPDYP